MDILTVCLLTNSAFTARWPRGKSTSLGHARERWHTLIREHIVLKTVQARGRPVKSKAAFALVSTPITIMRLRDAGKPNILVLARTH